MKYKIKSRSCNKNIYKNKLNIIKIYRIDRTFSNIKMK